MLLIEYRCPADGWPLYYDAQLGSYRCGACPPDWGPGGGIDKDNCRVVLGKGTGRRNDRGLLRLAGRVDCYYDRGRLKARYTGKRWYLAADLAPDQ